MRVTVTAISPHSQRFFHTAHRLGGLELSCRVSSTTQKNMPQELTLLRGVLQAMDWEEGDEEGQLDQGIEAFLQRVGGLDGLNAQERYQIGMLMTPAYHSDGEAIPNGPGRLAFVEHGEVTDLLPCASVTFSHLGRLGQLFVCPQSSLVKDMSHYARTA